MQFGYLAMISGKVPAVCWQQLIAGMPLMQKKVKVHLLYISGAHRVALQCIEVNCSGGVYRK